jgi:hypothetical protein
MSQQNYLIADMALNFNACLEIQISKLIAVFGKEFVLLVNCSRNGFTKLAPGHPVFSLDLLHGGSGIQVSSPRNINNLCQPFMSTIYVNHLCQPFLCQQFIPQNNHFFLFVTFLLQSFPHHLGTPMVRSKS